MHRPLIRAQLPRAEGHKDERQAPEFTIRQEHRPRRARRASAAAATDAARGAGDGDGGRQFWPRERHPIRQRFRRRETADWRRARPMGRGRGPRASAAVAAAPVGRHTERLGQGIPHPSGRRKRRRVHQASSPLPSVLLFIVLDPCHPGSGRRTGCARTGTSAEPENPRVFDMTDLCKARPVSSSASPTNDRFHGRSRRRRRAPGARWRVTYQGERLEENVRELPRSWPIRSCFRCDVTDDRADRGGVREIEQTFGGLDFVVHGAAYAPRDEAPAHPFRADDRATASRWRWTSAPIR